MAHRIYIIYSVYILVCVQVYMIYYTFCIHMYDILCNNNPQATYYIIYNIIVVVYAHVTSPSGHEHNSTEIIFQPFRVAAYQRYLYLNEITVRT